MGLAEKMKQQDSWAKDFVIFGLSIALVILVNMFSFGKFQRLDLTEDQRYSLDPHTKELLESGWVDQPMTIKVYLAGELPAELRKLKENISDKLEEIRAYAGNNVEYEFIDIYEMGDQAQIQEIEEYLIAQGEGIMYTELRSFSQGSAEAKKIWPGAEVIYGGASSNFITFFEQDYLTPDDNLALLTNSVSNELEYKLIKGMRRAIDGRKKTVGFLAGHDELTDIETWYARMALRESYVVKDVVIDGQINALDNIDILVVAGPKAFPEGLEGDRDLFIIDQFVMNGGKVAWFLDRVIVNEDSLRGAPRHALVESQRGYLYDMVYTYGARVEPIAVKDVKAAPFNSNVIWYNYPLVSGTDHPISNNIAPVRTEYPSPVKLVGEDGLEKTVLLKTSPNSIAVNASLPIVVPNPREQDPPDWKPMPGHEGYPIGVLLEGEFSSFFEGLLPPEFANNPDYKTKYKSDESRMIVVGDASVIANQVSAPVMQSGRVLPGRPFPINYDMFGYKDPQTGRGMYYGNQEFIENAIDYLAGDENLIELRTKNIILRPLDKQEVNTNGTQWKIINLVVPIISVLILAISVWFIRKKRYTT